MTLEHIVQTYGYPAILVGTFFEGETVLLIGGFLAYQGYLYLPLVMLTAFLGSFSGDQFYFIIGLKWGRAVIAKRPNWQTYISKVNRHLARHQNLIMLSFRFFYGIRIVTPFVIGLNKGIRPARFIAFNAVGASIWALAISGIGYLSGHAAKSIVPDVKGYELEILILMITVMALLWLLHRIRKGRE